MSLARHAPKRDTHEGSYVDYWRGRGACVLGVSGAGQPDTAVLWMGATLWAETKTGKRGLTPQQVRTFTLMWRAGQPVRVVRSMADAHALLAGTLAPWVPTSRQMAEAEAWLARQKPAPKHRPGTSRAKSLGDCCEAEGCPTSKAPGSRWCLACGRGNNQAG